MAEYLSGSYQSIYEVMWVFFLYAFGGWCTEVAYAALDTGKFVNRGFLNGPVCPIYGFGLVIVLGLLTPLRSSLLILLLGSIFLTTLLEYVVGALLEKCFHNKWWDYSKYPFNIKGYVCLKFSIIWGLACVFIVDIFHPFLMKLVLWIPQKLGYVLLFLMAATIFTDTVISILNVRKLNQRIQLLNEVGQQLHKISNEIGVNIYDIVIKTEEHSETVKTSLNEKKENLDEMIDDRKEEIQKLADRYKELLNDHHFGQARLLKAFPEMKSNLSTEALLALKKKAGIVKEGVDKFYDQMKDLKK